MSWQPYENGQTIGQNGSESGVITLDEEHVDGSRITLERDSPTAPFAITCGIYGWMVHTRYFSSEEEARSAYAGMKVDLARILNLIPYVDDPSGDEKIPGVVDALEEFIRRFP